MDEEGGYYDPFRLNVERIFVFVMGTDTVVVASACEAQSVAIPLSELPSLCGDIGSDPEHHFRIMKIFWKCWTCGLSFMINQRGHLRYLDTRRAFRSPLVWWILGRDPGDPMPGKPCRGPGVYLHSRS